MSFAIFKRFLLANPGGLVEWVEETSQESTDNSPESDAEPYNSWDSTRIAESALSSNFEEPWGSFISVKDRRIVWLYYQSRILAVTELYSREISVDIVNENLIKALLRRLASIYLDSSDTNKPFLLPADWLPNFLMEEREKIKNGPSTDANKPKRRSKLSRQKTKIQISSPIRYLFNYISSLVYRAVFVLRDSLKTDTTFVTVEALCDDVRMRLMTKNVATAAVAHIISKIKEAVSVEGSQLTSKNAKKVAAAAIKECCRIHKRRNVIAEISQAQSSRGTFRILVAGVNGVGKSTTLAKLAHWLRKMQDYKILVAACDTFRSGAVEQLRRHCEALGLDLYERGYGEDPCSVGLNALKKANSEGYNVLLIDTAGRMQDNTPLMDQLCKLISVVNPNMVLFIGEALVGNDGVDQIRKFNAAIHRQNRMIDGIILTKFDSVDDKIGAAVTLPYESGVPINFLGCGQNYDDLYLFKDEELIDSILN